MGNPFGGQKQQPQRNYELERQIAAQQEAERKRKAELEAKQKEIADKQAKGLYGSRSMFGKAGGRGYFDTV